MRANGWWRWMISWNSVQSSRVCFTSCLKFRTFGTASRPKPGCLFGMRTSDPYKHKSVADAKATAIPKFLDKPREFRRTLRTYNFYCDFAPLWALFGAQAMWNQNISEWNKIWQNQHSTASTTPDPAQGFTNGPIDEITCVPRVCLSNHAEGTPVHQSDSKATLAWPTGSKANSQHASQASRDVWSIVQTKRSVHVAVRVLLPCHSNDAKYHTKVRSIPRNLAAGRSYVAFCEKQRPVRTYKTNKNYKSCVARNLYLLGCFAFILP